MLWGGGEAGETWAANGAGHPTPGERGAAGGEGCHQGTPTCAIPALTHKDLIRRFKKGEVPGKAVARTGNIYV